jgi:hypothetical protein
MQRCCLDPVRPVREGVVRPVFLRNPVKVHAAAQVRPVREAGQTGFRRESSENPTNTRPTRTPSGQVHAELF